MEKPDFTDFSSKEIELLSRISQHWDAVAPALTVLSHPEGVEIQFEPDGYLFRVNGIFSYDMTENEIWTLVQQMHHAYLNEVEEIGTYWGSVMCLPGEAREHIQHEVLHRQAMAQAVSVLAASIAEEVDKEIIDFLEPLLEKT